MRAARKARKTHDLGRSLTLLRVFLLASALILVIGGVVLGWQLSRTLRDQALTSERSSLAQYVDGVVRQTLVRHDRVVVNQLGRPLDPRLAQRTGRHRRREGVAAERPARVDEPRPAADRAHASRSKASSKTRCTTT